MVGKNDADFQAVFEQLKAILQKTAAQSRLIVKADAAGGYSLDTPYSDKYKKEVFFGAVRINKNYVSYHLMPIYACPDLLDGISPELKKRMQGKSCFNFKSIKPEMLAELDQLTQKGRERFERDHLLD